MNLSEMSTFVRLQADTDTDDAPDATLTVYARAAYNVIQSKVWPWPQNLTTGTFSTVSGTAGYTLASLTGAPDMEYVTEVRSGTDVLSYVAPETFRKLSTEETSSGTPRFYTVDGLTIKLWPTPNAVATYTVEGYRSFAEWPSGADEPDLPRAFDEAICWYMLARYYQAQEDMELYQAYMRDFEFAVNQHLERALRGSALTAGPMIFGGNTSRTMTYSDWVKRGTEG